ncbi:MULTISPECIES: hypothetical protein [unclassified Granulicatella]|uniref:hypothetical protein n=1 Tax=unclassified Granulicatella TaxID=2630493 RepID=UPI001073C21A|nr:MULTISPECIES: hypothetical protein [unclassified Granulicatella]MBF0780776.1 hypothetical protein [Granulicatella sp. 19428wC4_WM01]TFU93849.1 hypothetical protein E4T68_06650 [Granulicatella sp. WM01]
MKKRHVLFLHFLLLLWFALDMTGFCFNHFCLVTSSYQDDGIFFFLYVGVIVLFMTNKTIGNWLSIIFLSLWFLLQFMAHEWYTFFDSGIMGNLQGKIQYFSKTVHWLVIEGKYIPDVYHTILHMLILLTLIGTIRYALKNNSSV